MEENRTNDPAYIKVYHQIKTEIQKGTYPIGSFIPKDSYMQERQQFSLTWQMADTESHVWIRS